MFKAALSLFLVLAVGFYASAGDLQPVQNESEVPCCCGEGPGQKSCGTCPVPSSSCYAKVLPTPLLGQDHQALIFPAETETHSPYVASFHSRSDRPLLQPPKLA